MLAYSTVSQLGYMFLGVGTGAITAGIFHLATHAFFKALLFLGSGSVIHAMHHAYHATHSHEDAQDMRNMGGLRHHLPVTWVLMWIATLAIAGIPPFAGFFSKDEILAFAFGRGEHEPIFRVFWAMGATAALDHRVLHGAAHGDDLPRGESDRREEKEHLHEAPWIMTGPLVILGLLSLAGGWLNLPEFASALGPTELLHHWLEPVTSKATAARGRAGVASWLDRDDPHRYRHSHCHHRIGLGLPEHRRPRHRPGPRGGTGPGILEGALPQVLHRRALRCDHRSPVDDDLSSRPVAEGGPGPDRWCRGEWIRRPDASTGLGSAADCRLARWASTWPCFVVGALYVLGRLVW